MAEVGALTPRQMRIVEERLKEIFTGPCPVCGERHFLLFPTMLGEGFYDAEGQYLTSATLGPKIRVTCHSCGYILYFSAETFGLFDTEGGTDG